MAKAISTVGISQSTVNKLNNVKTKVNTPFKSVTSQEIIDAVFSLPADKIIAFVASAKAVVVKNASPKKAKAKRRKKLVRVEPGRRKELLTALLKDKKVTAHNVREATSLYNYCLTNKKGKVSYKKVKRGVVQVTLAA